MAKIKLYLGDCLEKMKDIPDGSVDMVLTDLPYGTTACKWDTVIDLPKMWEQLKRVTKKNEAIVLFGSQPFTSALVMSNVKMFKYEWVWNKVKPSSGLHAKIQPLRQHENILVFGNPKYNPLMEKTKDRIDKPRIANNGEAFGGKEVFRQHKNNGVKYPRSILAISNANQTKRLHPHPKARRPHGIPNQDLHQRRRDGVGLHNGQWDNRCRLREHQPKLYRDRVRPRAFQNCREANKWKSIKLQKYPLRICRRLWMQNRK